MEQMSFEEFNRLATGNPVTLHMALDMLLHNGRRVIQREEPTVLLANCKANIGNFVMEDMLREMVEVCQRLAALETGVLLTYIQHGDLHITAPGAEEEGVCPICGCELEYGNDVLLDEGGYREWTCPGCGATGKEMYDKVFDQHHDVRDGDGNPYPFPAE